MTDRHHPGCLDVLPVDADFLDREPPVLGEDEEFNIVGESVESLSGGESAGEWTWKQLESALGITEPGQRKDTQENVESPTHEIAVERLTERH